jgi:rfaE bifunctional protein kinase chain/domain
MKNIHPFLTLTRLEKILETIPEVTMGVLGDFFLDYYLVLDKKLNEVSLETGLEAYQATSVRKSPGAAGTVATILRSLDCQVKVIGFKGNDGNGFDLQNGLELIGVDVGGFLSFEDKFTPTYMKPLLCQNGQETEISRIDIKNRKPLSVHEEDQIIQQLKNVINGIHGLVILDQVQERNCGVVTDRILSFVEQFSTDFPSKLLIADSREHGSRLKNVIIKCNLDEARKTLSITKQPDFEVNQIGKRLFDKTRKPVFITLGSDGILCQNDEGSPLIPALKIDCPIDVVGAGDSVMASMAASLCSGATCAEAASIAMIAASIIIQQIGTTGIVSRNQILSRYQQYFSS